MRIILSTPTDFVFLAAYTADPCKHAFCRSSHNAKFPNSDALGSLRQTIIGPYETSIVIPVTMTQKDNQTSVSSSTVRYETTGAVTYLSSLAA